jgi:hypothetical protein
MTRSRNGISRRTSRMPIGRGRWLLACICAFALLLPLLPVPGIASAAAGFATVEIGSALYDSRPEISGPRAVWETAEAGAVAIYTWTPTEGTVRIATDSSWTSVRPRVSGDRVVWQGRTVPHDDTTTEIFTWTPDGGTVRITTNATLDDNVDVSGDRVVWEGKTGSTATSYEIYTWTPSGGIVRLTANSTEDRMPRVSRDRIVWRGTGGSDGGTDHEIFTWTPGGATVQLTANSYQESDPQVSSDRVAWHMSSGFFSSQRDIYTWTPASGTVQITSTPLADEFPRVSGDRVVWTRYVGIAGLEIFSWTPSEGLVQLTNNEVDDYEPQVSGDRVVWSGVDGNSGGWEIYTWTLAGGTVQLTANTSFDSMPAVSGDRVVWNGEASAGGGAYSIYLWGPASEPGGPGASGQVTVSAEVAASQGEILSLTILAGSAPDGGTVSDASLDFGLVSPGTAKTGSHFLKVTTNAAAGYNVLTAESHPLQTRSAGTVIQPIHVIPDVTGDDGSITEAVTGPWLLNSTYGFGFTASGTDALFSGGYRQFADASLSETPQPVMTNSGPVEDSQIEVGYKLNVSPTQAAGVYTNTLVYVAIGNF